MRHLMNVFTATSLLLSGLAAVSPTAYAQRYPAGQDNYYAHDHERDQARLMDRVQTDLDRAEATTLPLTPEQNRIVRAREKVTIYERKMKAGGDSGRYLDDAIAAVQRVEDSNRNLSDVDRDNLASDLSRMRDYQSPLDGSQ
jgi:hypothetical protein